MIQSFATFLQQIPFQEDLQIYICHHVNWWAVSSRKRTSNSIVSRAAAGRPGVPSSLPVCKKEQMFCSESQPPTVTLRPSSFKPNNRVPLFSIWESGYRSSFIRLVSSVVSSRWWLSNCSPHAVKDRNHILNCDLLEADTIFNELSRPLSDLHHNCNTAKQPLQNQLHCPPPPIQLHHNTLMVHLRGRLYFFSFHLPPLLITLVSLIHVSLCVRYLQSQDFFFFLNDRMCTLKDCNYRSINEFITFFFVRFSLLIEIFKNLRWTAFSK